MISVLNSTIFIIPDLVLAVIGSILLVKVNDLVIFVYIERIYNEIPAPPTTELCPVNARLKCHCYPAMLFPLPLL